MSHRLLLCGPSLVLAACGASRDQTELLGIERAPADETVAVAHFELKSSLPSCRQDTAGVVYYVDRESKLYYCDGKRYQEPELACDPTWLVSAASAKTCANGGVSLSAGPDENENGKLDKKEVISSATACNGAPGPQGPVGATGPAGANGTNGTNGSSGATGPQGPAGADGRDGADGQDGSAGPPGDTGTDGSSCSIDDNGDHTYTVRCTDGTSATLHDGTNGSPGETGPQGPQGEPGATGATGPAGAPCSVHDNGDHTKTISCGDGGTVTVSDGVDASAASPLLRISSEAPGGNCSAGGHRVNLGIDADHDGILVDAEVTSTEYACAPGPACVQIHSGLDGVRGVGRVGDALFFTAGRSGLYRSSVTGGPVTLVYSVNTNPYIAGGPLVVDAGMVYWGVAFEPGVGSLWSTSAATNATHQLSPATYFFTMTQDQDALYYADHYGSGTVHRVDKATGANAALASINNSFSFLGLVDGVLYWVRSDGTIAAVPAIGGAEATVASTGTAPNNASAMASSADSIFWVSGNQVQRFRPSSGSVSTFYTAASPALGDLASSRETLFILSEGGLLSIPVATGVPAPMLPPSALVELGVDDQTLFAASLNEIWACPRR